MTGAAAAETRDKRCDCKCILVRLLRELMTMCNRSASLQDRAILAIDTRSDQLIRSIEMQGQ